MKRILKIAALALVIVLGSSLQNKTSAQDYNNRNDVSYQTFYDELSPYGQWVDYPGHGYVWVPDTGPDFRPYSTNGHWVWTDDYEWMWVSDYDWGWGPFHYGRWEEDNNYGWFWVPGYEWSPAWVAWRDGGDYYGWAPLRPGINISINFNIGSYSPPYNYWSFAPRRYITSPRIFDYCVDRRQNVTIINSTTIIINNNNRYGTNYGFRSGPSRYEAERYCGRINPVRFRDSYTPGRSQFRNNEISFYRPNVRQDNDRRTAPRQFERFDRNNNNRTARNTNRNDNANNQGQDRNRNNDFRQPRNNNDNNGQNNRTNDNRISGPTDRVDRNANPGNNNNNRRFERPNGNNGNNNTPTRENDVRRVDQPQRQVPQQQPRQFERRNNNNNGNNNTPTRENDVRRIDQPQRQVPQQQPRQFERRQQDVRSTDQPQRQQPQQMERRQEQRQPPVQQMERRQEQKQQPVQQIERKQEPQTRQSDRREQSTGNGNNGNGNNRRRF